MKIFLTVAFCLLFFIKPVLATDCRGIFNDATALECVICCDVDLPVFVGIFLPNYLVGCDFAIFRDRFNFSRSTCLSRGVNALNNQNLSGDAPYYEPWSRDCNDADVDPCPLILAGEDLDQDGYLDNVDCNDNSAAMHPGAVELCDGIDNNCNGTVDENIATQTWYRDYDMDGYGNPNNTTQSCLPLDQSSSSNNDQPRWSANNDDCADSRANVHPGAPEICDGLDNDCDGDRDEGSDADGDGFTACASDYSYQDCNDANPAVFPGMIEIACNGLDDDCNASTPDTSTPDNCPAETDGPGYPGWEGDDDVDVTPDVDGPGYLDPGPLPGDDDIDDDIDVAPPSPVTPFIPGDEAIPLVDYTIPPPGTLPSSTPPTDDTPEEALPPGDTTDGTTSGTTSGAKTEGNSFELMGGGCSLYTK